jgi:squalene synthase HpnC
MTSQALEHQALKHQASEHRTGKGHRDENFPVASHLIHPKHRPIILAFYNFVRTADDIADHPTMGESEKLALLDRLGSGLMSGAGDAEAVALHRELQARNLPPQHAQDLLTAFRLDVTKRRYQDWNDLIGYCRYSAMPVGRFVLDVHGESPATWPMNDALCAALQIINHLQDCGEDYRNLNRVYVPLDALAAAGSSVEALGESKASPALRACLTRLARQTAALLHESRDFAPAVNDIRLSLEVSVIQTLAERLVGMLAARDPLSERVHLGKAGVAGWTAVALARSLSRRALGRRTSSVRLSH